MILLFGYTTCMLLRLSVSRNRGIRRTLMTQMSHTHTPAYTYTHIQTSIFSFLPLSVQSIFASLSFSLTLSSQSNLCVFWSVLLSCPLMKSDVSFYASWLNLTEQWRETQDTAEQRIQCKGVSILHQKQKLTLVSDINTTFINLF